MKFLFALLFFPVVLVAQNYPVRHYNTNDGLSSNIVYDAIQDKNGYLWFATNTGVSKFDGKSWKNYSVDDGLGDNEILKIRMDAKSRIWLFCFNGALNVIDNDTIHSPKNNKTLKQLGFGQFYRTYYANANDSIWVYNNSTNPYLISWPFKVQQATNKNTLVIFQHDKGLLKLSEKYGYSLPEGDWNWSGFEQITFKSWHVSTNGTFIGLFDKYILKITKKGLHTLYKIQSAPSGLIVDLYFKNENSLWISAETQGILHYELEKNEFILKEKLLSENYITSTTIDNEGNHWFTSYGGGIYMLPFNYPDIQHYSEKSGLYESNTFAVCVDNHNQLWAGHKYEYVDVIGSKKSYHFQLTNDNLTVGRVGKIKKHPSGKILLSCDEGFIVFDHADNQSRNLRRVYLQISESKNYQEQPIKDFCIDSKGNIYIASQENVHYLSAESLNEKKLIAKRLKLPLKRVFSVAVDQNDQLWVGTVDGLGTYKNNGFTPVLDLSDKYSNRIENMAFVNDDLYLSVIGYGILIVKNNQISTRLSVKEGMLSNHCTRIFIHNQEVYVCSNKGLNKIVKNEQRDYAVTQLTSFLFNGSQQVNDVYVDHNRIYIASLNGIHVLKKSTSFSATKIEPKVYLTEINYGGKTHTRNEKLKLSYGDRHIVFKFAAPSYYHPEGIRYEYKINAGPWLDLAIPQLELNAMVPGSYELQIRAKHNESQWSSPLQYTFTVERPFYLSWWFYTLLGFGIIGWLYFNYLQKIKKLQKDQKTRLEYEQEINRLQLKSLQAMINPHFVFNSLSAIQQEINAGDAKKANNYLTRFSRLLRKNLENLNESFITLDEEISMLTLYLDTEKMRLDDQLDYEIKVQPGMDPHNTWLPTMLLQPIVENAIWHGIAASGVSGKVLIQFELINDRLHIAIDDNGLGIEKSRTQKNLQMLKGKALGMSITQDRLIFLERKIGSPITFDVIDKKQEGSNGTRVVITMSADM